MKRILPVVLILFLLGGLFSCTQKSEYEQLVDRELSREVQMDSLFLGYYFGMPLEEFLSHSLELNRQQIITGGSKIKYRFDQLDNIAIMEFYPEFRDREIVELPIEVQYEGWAPWNTHLASDSLIADLIEFYEDHYDTSFINHTFEGDETPSYVAVQGNRQIKIYRKNTQFAGIDFVDLTAQANTQ